MIAEKRYRNEVQYRQPYPFCTTSRWQNLKSEIAMQLRIVYIQSVCDPVPTVLRQRSF